MRSIASLLLLCGCAPSMDVPIFDAKSYLLVRLSSDGAAERITAYDAPLAPLILEGLPGSKYRVLGYSAPISDLDLVVLPEGEIDVVHPAAPDEDTWPPPTPERWGELTAGGFTEMPVDALATWLETVKVNRPACGGPPVFRLIPKLKDLGIERRVVTFAARLGTKMIVGFRGQKDAGTDLESSPRLVRIDVADQDQVEDLSGDGSPFPIGPPAVGPVGFVDEGRVWIAWPTTSSISPYFFRTISEDGTIGERVDLTFDASLLDETAQVVQLAAMAAGRFDGARTVVATIRGGAMAALDEATHHLSLVRAPVTPNEPCGGSITRILEVDGPGVGLIGLNHESVNRFDLSKPSDRVVDSRPVIMGGPYCRNAHTVLASGLEILLGERESDDGTELAWRMMGEESWQRYDDPLVTAQAIVPLGNAFLVTATLDGVAYFEFDPRRPTVRPRRCGGSGVYQDSHTLVDAGGRTIFVGGQKGASFLDFPKNPAE